MTLLVENEMKDYPKFMEMVDLVSKQNPLQKKAYS